MIIFRKFQIATHNLHIIYCVLILRIASHLWSFTFFQCPYNFGKGPILFELLHFYFFSDFWMTLYVFCSIWRIFSDHTYAFMWLYQWYLCIWNCVQIMDIYQCWLQKFCSGEGGGFCSFERVISVFQRANCNYNANDNKHKINKSLTVGESPHPLNSLLT